MTTNEENFKYCHQIMKEHSKSFSYAFDFLPEQERQAVWVIYAVCRIIDDSIDVHENPQILKIFMKIFHILKTQVISAITNLKVINLLW